MNPEWLRPDWPAPPGVRAFSTTRAGGFSTGPWASLNLGARCGDEPAAVARNRRELKRWLPASPLWLHQVHGTAVARHPGPEAGEPEADACVAEAPGQVCAVLTADCLPVLFCDRRGERVAAAHAGWRGLAAGVLEATIGALGGDPAELLAWLGPAIGPTVYEVGGDVRDAFVSEASPGFSRCFVAHGERWMFDLYAAARQKLAAAGLGSVHGGGFCTYSDPGRFYSFRRDGRTGRMASVIWLE